MAIKKETAEEFIKRLKSLPKVDLTDPRAVREFGNRMDVMTEKEIERISSEQARNLGRVFRPIG
jgi:hypothetical protein